MTEASLQPSSAAAVLSAASLATFAALHPSGGALGFTLNNLVACLVATELLQLLGLRSFRAATLLLVGLLAYDVFWVFASPAVVGDNVMLAVATSDAVTGPTRLLFPRVPGGGGEAANFPFSLLGLGDVAIPGLLAALALRYDASRRWGARGDVWGVDVVGVVGAARRLEPQFPTPTTTLPDKQPFPPLSPLRLAQQHRHARARGGRRRGDRRRARRLGAGRERPRHGQRRVGGGARGV